MSQETVGANNHLPAYDATEALQRAAALLGEGKAREAQG